MLFSSEEIECTRKWHTERNIAWKRKRVKIDGKKNRKIYQLLRINSFQMELWWYAKVQFVFSKQNYKCTNKQSKIFFRHTFGIYFVLHCMYKSGEYCNDEEKSEQRSFLESNKFLCRNCLFCTTSVFCFEENVYKKIYCISSCEVKNMTDINVKLLVFWFPFSSKCYPKTKELHAWKCYLKCSKHILWLFLFYVQLFYHSTTALKKKIRKEYNDFFGL